MKLCVYASQSLLKASDLLEHQFMKLSLWASMVNPVSVPCVCVCGGGGVQGSEVNLGYLPRFVSVTGFSIPSTTEFEVVRTFLRPSPPAALIKSLPLSLRDLHILQ